jgi:glyoxalase family protein
METNLLGLHHITAIADNAKRNHAFYTETLGLRLVKKTVNFDDPGTYHFYYGDEIGTPGTILTFFPWEGIGKGVNGVGMATHIGYSVPKGSLDFWQHRLTQSGVQVEVGEVMGDRSISFLDPDGLQLQFVEAPPTDHRDGWETTAVGKENALKGFYYVALTLRRMEPTARILTDILGYELSREEGSRSRFITPAIGSANAIDIIENSGGGQGRSAGGTNHHIAFRVKNEEVLMEYRE